MSGTQGSGEFAATVQLEYVNIIQFSVTVLASTILSF
jgi:hypothetical protein